MSPSTDHRENREFATEAKFLVSRHVADQIRDWARTRLAPDPNASTQFGDAYQITSLYFDTAAFDVFHRKGSFGRSKYRIRQYGVSESAFLERKLKTRGLVSKRRSLVKIEELEKLCAGVPVRPWAGHWFHRRLLARGLKPICQIGYRRTARVCLTEHGPIRLTLDDNIRALPSSGLTFNDDPDGVLLSENQVILELKYRLEMPGLFKQLIEEFALDPAAVSKYRLAVTALGFVREPSTPTVSRRRPESPLCLIF